EVGRITKRSDRDALKHLITVRKVTVRKPYGRYDTVKPALASLIGTINNEAGFLTDPTGNRRFLVCRLTAIDWRYARQIDPHQVWAEAVALYQSGEPGLPTPEETRLQQAINQTYLIEPLRSKSARTDRQNGQQPLPVTQLPLTPLPGKEPPMK
ncbi:MAG: hypothetical protein GY798_29990, partial [Hyphomicrobiales bacterium]|nr:hypothetical protein [Hyphomicrobiales bacterium]